MEKKMDRELIEAKMEAGFELLTVKLENIAEGVIRTEAHAANTNGKIAKQEQEIFEMKIEMEKVKAVKNQRRKDFAIFGTAISLMNIILHWVFK